MPKESKRVHSRPSSKHESIRHAKTTVGTETLESLCETTNTGPRHEESLRKTNNYDTKPQEYQWKTHDSES